MADKAGAAATKAVSSSPQQQSVLRRLMELLMMLVSMLLVLFTWGEANKAKEEAASLRGELRRARGEQAHRWQCVVWRVAR